jgi:hypothetical protein
MQSEWEVALSRERSWEEQRGREWVDWGGIGRCERDMEHEERRWRETVMRRGWEGVDGMGEAPERERVSIEAGEGAPARFPGRHEADGYAGETKRPTAVKRSGT